MVDSIAAQIARLDVTVQGVLEDVVELRREANKRDRRLRLVEETQRIIADRHEVSEVRQERAARRIEVRLQILTFAVGVAAFLSPILFALVHR